ncbi:hypothetical protein PSQ90_15350 [Devosia rhodophyticola]|uniref:Phage tail assembly chaperone n=1 Tax=Devosia rhodophyticola TaxID=3026423 RepID=A0ABY7YWR8_9HYPH|nr:hypothetical protein [Devosia rhodophyticola]WDR05622.1 hypothetical protein PSQ90_15350 [Devosia rhodophyticola]
MAELIGEGTGSPKDAETFGFDIHHLGARALSEFQMPLLEFITCLAGIEPGSRQAPTTGNAMPMTDYFEHLFKIATGWLGWTPDQAWEATPAEIIAAKEGRTDLVSDILKAVFGGESDSDQVQSPTANDEFDRAAFNALKAKIARG